MKLSDNFDASKSKKKDLVPLIQLTGCKWPMDSTKGVVFCNSNENNSVLASYCNHHARLAYQPGSRRK